MAPETMLAAVYAGGGALDVRELPIPELGPHDALVRISHCGNLRH
jgi:D-arabinose 1-dehydrogenase-like Zn-dependent alcohol dehydrogenase